MAFVEEPGSGRESFLGRQNALKTVLAGCDDALSHGSTSPRVCLIRGPSGVGKERLLGELCSEALDAGITVLEAGEGGRSLGGLLPFLRSALEGGEGLVSETLLEQVRGLLDDAREGGRASLDAVGVAEFLLATTTRPTVFIVPNVERQDPLTQACLLQIIRQLVPNSSLDREIRPPCYWAISYSIDAKDAVHEFGLFDSALLTVDLEGLDHEELSQFIRALLGSQPLPPEALKELHQITRGIPGRVSDAVFALREAGTLVQQDDGWSLAESNVLELPSSPAGIIQRRIGALTRTESTWLQTLAIESRPFSMAYALDVTRGNSQILHEWCERSILEQTWLETSLCLRFVSTDLREELVATMEDPSRQNAHERRATWIEKHLPTHEAIEPLARHWAEAGKPDRAISFFIASGQRSQSVGDIVSTVEWYRRAMVLLESLELPLSQKHELEQSILLPLGAAERSNAEHLYAEERFRRLVELAKERSDWESLGAALDRLALVLIETGRLTEAMQSAQERLQIAKDSADRRGQAMALRLVGVIRRELDGPAAGIGDLEEALRVAGDGDAMADVRARVAIALSYAHTESGNPEEGLRWAMWGLKISRDAKFNELEVSFLINISMAQFNLGRPDLTLRWATEAMEVCEERGLKRYYMLALGNAGDAMRALGRFHEAEQTLRAALKETYKTGGPDLQIARMLELAHLLLDKGDATHAMTYLAEAWRLQPRMSNTHSLVALGLAELRLRLGTLCSNEKGSNTTSTEELLATVMGWAATATDTLPELELMVYAGLFNARSGHLDASRDIAKKAYVLSEKVLPSRIISRPDLAAGLLALLTDTKLEEQEADFRSRVARAIDGRAASIDDANMRKEYLTIPLIAHLSK